MDSADWVNLSDDELLEKKISKLGLRLEGSELEPMVHRLFDCASPTWSAPLRSE
jgi:hypothetical protein